MTQEPLSRGQVVQLLCLAILLLGLGSIDVGFWPANFVVLIPLFILLHRGEKRATLWPFAAFFAWQFWLHYAWILSVAELPWLRTVNPWFPVLTSTSYFLAGLGFGVLGFLFALLARWLLRTYHFAWLMIAIAWLLFELLASFCMLTHPLQSLGFQMVNLPPFLTWPLAIAGVWGLSAVVLVINYLFFRVVMRLPIKAKPILFGLVVYLGLGITLSGDVGTGDQATLRLLKTPPGFQGGAAIPALANQFFSEGGEELLVLPEETYSYLAQDELSGLDRLASFLTPSQTLLVGIARDSEVRDNMAILLLQKGELARTGKVSPVVFGERLPFASLWPAGVAEAISAQVRPWPTPQNLSYKNLAMGILFCSELFENSRISAIVSQGASTIMTLSNIQDIPHPMLFREFLAATKLRALEYHRPSLYVSNQGPVAAYDAAGNSLGEVAAEESHELVVKIAGSTSWTPRMFLTDPVVFGLLLFGFLSLVYNQKRNQREGVA